MKKKLVTYPRTDARVLSTAVAKRDPQELKRSDAVRTGKAISSGYREIRRPPKDWRRRDMSTTNRSQTTMRSSRTGQGMGALKGLPNLSQRVYDVIVRRFLSIFYPPAVYQKVSIVTKIKEESFFSSFKVLAEEGYLKVTGVPGRKNDNNDNNDNTDSRADSTEDKDTDAAFFARIQSLKKGMTLSVQSLDIKEGKTSPPKRYNSGSLILAMENAGQLIEDEELRAQIKGSGIGTSATRGEILKKLFNNKYLALNKKTQIVTPTMLGEMIYDVVDHSIRPLLNPELTASWEKRSDVCGRWRYHIR